MHDVSKNSSPHGECCWTRASVFLGQFNLGALDGKCLVKVGIGPIGITLLFWVPAGSGVYLCGAFLWKKRRESQSRWYTSGSSTGYRRQATGCQRSLGCSEDGFRLSIDENRVFNR